MDKSNNDILFHKADQQIRAALLVSFTLPWIYSHFTGYILTAQGMFFGENNKKI